MQLTGGRVSQVCCHHDLPPCQLSFGWVNANAIISSSRAVPEVGREGRPTQAPISQGPHRTQSLIGIQDRNGYYLLYQYIFEFVRRMDCYHNIFVAYRILFTIPITVASVERSFSKLKLLKNYLRSTMSQERLNGLATLCIEKKLLDDVNIEAIIDDFASRNVRRHF